MKKVFVDLKQRGEVESYEFANFKEFVAAFEDDIEEMIDSDYWDIPTNRMKENDFKNFVKMYNEAVPELGFPPMRAKLK